MPKGHYTRRPKPIEERFWAKVDTSTTDPDGCWPWTGSRLPKGYGKIGADAAHGGWKVGWILAHRVAYELQIGPIPEGHEVLHKCDSPPCQRGKHFFTGTTADNMRDKVSKGRHLYGENAPQAKLSAALVLDLRQRYQAGERQADLMRRFSISRQNTSVIVNGQTWRHLLPPESDRALG